MENSILTQDTTKIMPEAPPETMTVQRRQPQQQTAPYASAIESFVKGPANADEPNQVLTVSFTVSPKNNELKGIKLMEAVLKACGEVEADIHNFTIRKDEKK